MNTLQPLVDFYRDHKWGQGYSHSADTDAYCIMGALLSLRAVDRVSILRAQLTKRVGQRVARWNDNPKRTLEDVMEMLSGDDV